MITLMNVRVRLRSGVFRSEKYEYMIYHTYYNLYLLFIGFGQVAELDETFK